MSEGQYQTCKICGECKANPLHVNKAHMMSWNEYKRVIQDPEFLKDVQLQRELREKQQKDNARKEQILLYNWFVKPGTLLRTMERYKDHAKSSKKSFRGSIYDLSEFDGQTEAIVGTVELAEAMTKNGWECVTTKGGREGIPKQYIMRKVE